MRPLIRGIEPSAGWPERATHTTSIPSESAFVTGTTSCGTTAIVRRSPASLPATNVASSANT